MNAERIVGPVVVLGCFLVPLILGTFWSIKRTKGPRERACMVKASIVLWSAGILFCGLGCALRGYAGQTFIPWFIFVCLAMSFIKRARQRIRQEEAQHQAVGAAGATK